MFAGVQVEDLFAKAVKLNESQDDIAVPANQCRLVQTESGIMLAIADLGTYRMTRHFENQLVQDINTTFDCGLYMKYFDATEGRITPHDERDLKCVNVNTWLRHMNKEKMVRCYADLDGEDIARAWLSAQYRRLDYCDLLEAIMEPMIELNEQGRLKFTGLDITEVKLHVKWILPEFTKELIVGPGHQRIHHEVAFGGHAGTSEVGASNLFAQAMSYVEWCTNQAVHVEFGKKVRHIGTKDELSEDEFTEETRKLRDAATWHEFRDIVSNTVNERWANEIHKKMQKAAGIEVPDVESAVEVLRKKWDRSEKQGKSILFHYSQGGWGGNTLFGLSSAVTRAAEDQPDMESATEMEMLGGKLLNMTQAELKELLATA